MDEKVPLDRVQVLEGDELFEMLNAWLVYQAAELAVWLDYVSIPGTRDPARFLLVEEPEEVDE